MRSRGRKIPRESFVSSRQQLKHKPHVVWMAFVRSLIEQVVPRPPLPLEDRELQSAPYRVYLARTEDERRAAFRLRFRVFNLELNEGLESAYQTGEDTDEFDPFCDHLVVQDDSTGSVVGTYRVQTGISAM